MEEDKEAKKRDWISGSNGGGRGQGSERAVFHIQTLEMHCKSAMWLLPLGGRLRQSKWITALGV